MLMNYDAQSNLFFQLALIHYRKVTKNKGKYNITSMEFW